MKLYNHAGRSLNMVFYEESKPRQWRKTHLSFQFENCQPLRFGMVRHLHVGFDVFEHCPPSPSPSPSPSLALLLPEQQELPISTV